MRRSNSASAQLGLTVLLKTSKRSYQRNAVDDYYGFRVLVHNPYDFPEVEGKGFAIGAGNVAYIAVGAQHTESTEAVKDMHIARRNCILHEDTAADMYDQLEVKLDIFSNYSRQSCLMECRARKIFQQCGCLPYFFPRFDSVWNKNTNCDLDGLECMRNHTTHLNALHVDDDWHGGVPGPECNCPDDCIDTMYMPELSQIKLRTGAPILDLALDEFGFIYEGRKLADKLEEQGKEDLAEEYREYIDKEEDEWPEDAVVVHVHFKDLGIIKYSRDQLYGTIDVIGE